MNINTLDGEYVDIDKLKIDYYNAFGVNTNDLLELYNFYNIKTNNSNLTSNSINNYNNFCQFTVVPQKKSTKIAF